MPKTRLALGISAALPGVALLLAGCTGEINSASNPGSEPGGGPGPGAGPVVGPTAPPTNSAPGVTQLRRLTVLEYRNTVRDLLGLTDVQMPELSGDQQAKTSGYTTGAAITTSTDARKILD